MIILVDFCRFVVQKEDCTDKLLPFIISLEFFSECLLVNWDYSKVYDF